MDQSQLAKLIDHTLLKPQSTETEIVSLCREAKEYKFETKTLEAKTSRVLHLGKF